jgi:hypothetical protein
MSKAKILSLLSSGFAVVFLTAILAFNNSSETLGANPDGNNVTGYAWSSNIGWISFSGKAADGSSYGVEINPQGEFSGYAWSSNIGWISFNQANLTGCPIAPCIAKVEQTNGIRKVTGWAKVLSINSWISFSSKAADGSSYGVEINPQGEFSGYAWENSNVGWISFRGVSADGSTYGVSTKPLPVSCYFYAQPASVPEFSKTTLYWDCQNVKSCSIDGMAMSAKGSKEITLKKGSALYTLSCAGLDDSIKNYPTTIKTFKPGIKEIKP